jgi:hypothetical protein
MLLYSSGWHIFFSNNVLCIDNQYSSLANLTYPSLFSTPRPLEIWYYNLIYVSHRFFPKHSSCVRKNYMLISFFTRFSNSNTSTDFLSLVLSWHFQIISAWFLCSLIKIIGACSWQFVCLSIPLSIFQ